MFRRFFSEEISAVFGGGHSFAWWVREVAAWSVALDRWHGRSEAIRGAESELYGAGSELLGPAPAVIVTPAAAPSDPLFSSQWHLENNGQTGGTAGADINVVDVWDDYTGQGVLIGVVDTAMQNTHPDLAGAINAGASYDAWQGDFNPFPPNGSENHATAVAGTIVAQPDNGIGVAGVAPDAEVASFRMSFGSGTQSQIADNMWRQVDVDISNNSWGYNGYFYDNFESATFASAAAGIENAVMNGRDGLGTVIIFAAGNSRTSGQNVNHHSFQNSPYTIAVAALNDDGEHASFSTPGAALLLAAPGDNILTTDKTGGSGYASGDYVTIDGTSFSSPITAGVVALMMEANDQLGYRDVQEILAYSARLTDGTDPGWAINGADNWNGGGLHTSHDYGFGFIDAHAAVRLAETWHSPPDGPATYATQDSVSASSGALFQNIPDGAGSLISQLVLPDTILIDHVTVAIEIDHSWIGDLIVTLVSPDGTESVLINRPGKNPNSFSGFGTSQDDIFFTLSTTNHWGETSGGTWTLIVEDVEGAFTGQLDRWTLTAYGDTIVDDSVYIFNDEFFEFGAAGYELEDSGGNDVLNAAAVTSDSFIDLTPGAQSTIDGKNFGIGDGTEIEWVYGGDGNDQLIGNTLDNHLGGGRGDDSLDGGAGNDTAYFSGEMLDYIINTIGDVTTVTDNNTADGDDGTDSLRNIEDLSFSDQVMGLGFAPPPAPNAPPSVSLTNVTTNLAEDASTLSRVKVADIVVSDDGTGTNVLSLVGADAALFEIDGFGHYLKAGTALDHETNDSLNVTVRVNDPAVGANPDDTAPLSIAVDDVNEAPSVSLSNVTTSLSENASTTPRIKVADIDVTDDALGTNNLSLVGADSGLFEIDNFKLYLKTGTDLDAIANPSLDVTVRVDDPAVGANPDDTAPLSIAVNEVNDPPSVSLTNVTASLPEDQDTSSAVKVADIVITDDGTGTNVLSLVGADAALFEIDGFGLYLKAGTALDHETNDSLDVTVRVNDPAVGANPDDTAPLSIAVDDVNEAPSVSLSNVTTSLSENASTTPRIKVADIDVTDDALGTNNLSLVGADSGLFEIDNFKLYLKTGTDLDAIANPSLDVTVRVDDPAVGANPDDTAPLSIAVNEVNDPPSVSLTNVTASLPEDQDTSSAVKVADIVVTDDGTGTNNLSLSGPDKDLFVILAGVLYLKAGTALDFETQPQLNVSVEVDDATVGATPDGTAPLSLTITDANDAPEVDQGIADQSTEEGAGYSFDVPAVAFSDQDAGDSLSYAAALVGGGALPAWLDFTGGTFSGTPDGGDVGPLNIEVTATDGSGESASTAFELEVTAAPLGSITGSSGDDVLLGTSGDDFIYGLQGDDVMTGGAGRDVFVWQAGEGGSGGKNAGIEVTDTVTDFTVDLGDPTQNDALDLSALLATVTPDSEYLQYQLADVNGDSVMDTSVRVDYNGEVVSEGFDPTLAINLHSINLFAAHGVAAGNHDALTNDLIANGNLIV